MTRRPDESPPTEDPAATKPLEPTNAVGAGTQAAPAEVAATASGDQPPQRRKPHNWRYIRWTRIRTSTAIFAILFVGCAILHGYTVDRYEPKSSETARPVRSPVRTPEQTYETPSSTSFSSTSVPSTTSTSVGDSEGATDTQGGQSSTSQSGGSAATTTTPGVPDLRTLIPGLTGTTLTTTPAR